MTANIQGSVLSSVSLDGCSASMILNPMSNVVNHANVVIAAGVTTTTWVNSGSNLIATITISNPGTAIYVDGQKVAMYWSTGGKTEGVISAANTTSFVATFPAGTGWGTGVGALTLPATNTSCVLSIATEIVDMTFNGTNCVQLLITSTQPGSCVLRATTVVQLEKYLTNAGDFYNYPTATGEASPVTGDAITNAAVYNNSLFAATFQVVAGV